jgi:type II secretion system protein H
MTYRRSGPQPSHRQHTDAGRDDHRARRRFARRTRPACGRGFTLVEILMVVVILGIAGAIIVPSLGGRGDIKVAAAARALTADLTYAQNLAIVQQKPFYVRFDGQTYSLWTKTNGTLTRVTHPIDKNDYSVTLGTGGRRALQDVTLSAVSIGSGATALAFDELGSPMAADLTAGTNTALAQRAVFTISCGSYSIQVRVEPFTGEVTTATP